MIRIYKDNKQLLYLTLQENRVFDHCNYLFVFENPSSGRSYKFMIPDTEDQSSNKGRINIIPIDSSSYFSEFVPGEYNYTVYEVDPSITSADVALASKKLETGLSLLIDGTIEPEIIPSFKSDITIKSWMNG